jgi:ABC-type polysaccharide/polyol phosphate export permease
MWPFISVALEAALLSVVSFALLSKAKAPNKASPTEMVALNVVCVGAASIFALFLDNHGRPPVIAYIIAALEPLLLAAVLATQRTQRRSG